MRTASERLLLPILLSLVLAGCGSVPVAASHRHASPGRRPAPFGWLRLPVTGSGTALAISALQARGPTVTLALSPFTGSPLFGTASSAVARTVRLQWPDPRAQTVSAQVPPPTPSGFRLAWPNQGWYTAEGATVPRVEAAGSPHSLLPVAWPAAVPTYWSAINPPPVNPPYLLDSQVLGRSGNWLFVALKGPKTAVVPGVFWGFRVWDRLLALNLETGRYRLYRFPARGSFRLRNANPVLRVTPRAVWVGIGNWLGRLPLPPSTAPLPVLTGTPPAVEQARLQTIRSSLQHLTWQNIDGAATFWNCYVMADPSRSACPSGVGPQAHYGGFGFSPVFAIHQALPAHLAWALSYPYPATLRPVALRDLRQTLSALGDAAYYANAMETNPAPSAVRSKFHGTPPVHLPGYVRRSGYYWAKSP